MSELVQRVAAALNPTSFRPSWSAAEVDLCVDVVLEVPGTGPVQQRRQRRRVRDGIVAAKCRRRQPSVPGCVKFQSRVGAETKYLLFNACTML